MKQKVIVAADIGWSVGRIHRDLATHLGHKYDFVFFNASHCNIQDFIAQTKQSSLVLTTYNLYNDMVKLFSDPQDLQKIVMVCHGYPDIVYINKYDHNARLVHEYSEDGSNPSKQIFILNHHRDIAYPLKRDLCPHITYAVASDVLLPFFTNLSKVFVTPNGVDPANFVYQKRSGIVKMLGWCSALVGFKRHPIGLAIASRAKLPISYATSLPADALKEWYLAIDILIVTSGPAEYDETGPLSPFEAVASGCVTIGFPVGNFRKIPGPKCFSVQDIVDAIHMLQNDPKAYQDLAKQQYDFVMHHWNMKILAQEWDTALEGALQKQNIAVQPKN